MVSHCQTVDCFFDLSDTLLKQYRLLLESRTCEGPKMVWEKAPFSMFFSEWSGKKSVGWKVRV